MIEKDAKGTTLLNYLYVLAALDLEPESDRIEWAWIEA